MRTKILLVILSLFTLFVLAGCKETTTNVTTTAIDVTEPVDAPTGLSISGKVLSWNAVPGVTMYRIYVNGVETTTVRNATAYNFTGLTGDSIVFNVVAVGPAGYDDSPLSVSIAYVADPATVIAAINAVATAEGMELPDGVAATLVSKGITGPIFQNDVDAMKAMQEAMDAAAGDMEAMNTALTAFLGAVSNFEAYVSAFITVMPDMIDQQVANEEESRDYWQALLDQYPDDPDYAQWVAEAQASIDNLTALKAVILENEEQVVITAMAVVNYLIAFQDQITNTLIANIQALQENPDATSAEIVLVKDEVTTLLLENLPSVDDLTLVFDLLAILEDAMNGAETTMTADLANEYANVFHISIELAVRFIASIDATFIDDMQALDDMETYTDAEANVERAILFLVATHDFQAENQVLIDSLDAVFTDAQKEEAFNAFIDSYVALLIAQGVPEEQAAIVEEILADLTYALADAGIAVFDDLGQKAFDELATSDGELLRKIGYLQNFYDEYDWWSETTVYGNWYTNETFDDYTAYNQAETVARYEMMDELFAFLDETMGTVTEAQFLALTNLVFAGVPEETLATQIGLESAAFGDLLDLIQTTLGTADADAVALFTNLIGYLAAEHVFADLATLTTELDAYNLSTYGADYLNNAEYDGGYSGTAYVIFFAHHLDAWVTTTQETQIHSLLAAAFDVMADEGFLAASGMTAEQVTDLETAFTQMVDDLIAQATVIAGYDYSSLTSDQQTDVQDFIAILQNGIGGNPA